MTLDRQETTSTKGGQLEAMSLGWNGDSAQELCPLRRPTSWSRDSVYGVGQASFNEAAASHEHESWARQACLRSASSELHGARLGSTIVSKGILRGLERVAAGFNRRAWRRCNGLKNR